MTISTLAHSAMMEWFDIQEGKAPRPPGKQGEILAGIIQRALDAAASVRAEVGTSGMEILRLVATIDLHRDNHPDQPDWLGSKPLPLTPAHVRQARAIVAAAERKEVMPSGSDSRPTQANDTAPPTAGPIPAEGARNQFLKSLRASRGLTLRDVERITEGKISNAYLSQLENGQIKTPSAIMLQWLSAAYAVDYIELMEKGGFIAATPSQQPPAPAAPDMAGLIETINEAILHRPRGVELTEVLQQCRDALTAQATALAAKEAEIERRTAGYYQDCRRIAALEAALQAAQEWLARVTADTAEAADYLNGDHRDGGGGRSGWDDGVDVLAKVSAALSKKEPQQP